WVLADIWTGDIISQHTFSAALDTPTSFAAVPTGGPTACVWELPIHSPARDAFVAPILDPATGPDADAYIADTLTIPARSNRELVAEFNQAWADGDVDSLMAVMDDRPTYRASTGNGPGTDYRGPEQVRDGFAAVIANEANSNETPPPPGEIHIFGDRGLSFWSYPTTGPNGETVLVEGVDVWTFANGRILTKDAYRKAFPAPPAEQPSKAPK
ncbi:MAG: nuclear transport factor 2 family protein, partial [bacterium]|nr:nuclear transport factor 2 family protein [bacterium]